MMFSIIEHIEYLVTRHDCVTIPGWGAFIANYTNAGYNGERASWSCPRRTIGFNSMATHNDGLLAQSIMRREGMDYDQAMRFIADSVVAFRQQLSMDNEVSLGRIGFFRNCEGRKIEFVPNVNANSVDNFYGLDDLKILTVEAMGREPKADGSVAPNGRNLFIRKATRIAASIVVLLGLGVMLTTPIIVDREHQSMAGLAPTVTAPQSQQLGVTVQDGVVAQDMAPVAAYPGISAVGNTSGKYYMVIATLRNQQELDAFKNKYPDLVPSMKMLDYKGMTCVYVARSDDYGKLMSLRDELPQPLRDVWIYN